MCSEGFDPARLDGRDEHSGRLPADDSSRHALGGGIEHRDNPDQPAIDLELDGVSQKEVIEVEAGAKGRDCGGGASFSHVEQVLVHIVHTGFRVILFISLVFRRVSSRSEAIVEVVLAEVAKDAAR